MEQDPSAAPPVVQRMEADPRNSDRVVVTVGPADGSVATARTLTLHIAVVAEAGLYTGQACPPEMLARLQAGDEFQTHYARALGFLAVRPRSEAEVRQRMRRKAVPPDIIEAVVARLYRARYLDDAAFARYWIGERARSSPRGARLLRTELRTKGVSPAVIDAALVEFEADAQAEDALQAAALDAGRDGSEPESAENDEASESREVREALGLARRKLRNYAGLDSPTFRRRMGGFLLRRGYGYDVVGKVLKRMQAPVEELEDEAEA